MSPAHRIHDSEPPSTLLTTESELPLAGEMDPMLISRLPHFNDANSAVASRSGSETSSVHAPHHDKFAGTTGAGVHNPALTTHDANETATPLAANTPTSSSSSHPFSKISSEDMRAKMTLALEEHLHDHPESRYVRTLALEGSSPKPCIVPGNALQLIDDDPDRAHSPPPIIIIANQVNLAGSSHDSPSDPETTGSSVDPEVPRRPVPKVRFRSRVRITSGVRKHRHLTPGAGLQEHQAPSTCSSCSGSPSSSISAPLRWHADENATWGPLGRRLSAYAGSHKRTTTTPPKLSEGMRATRTDERTPLIGSQRARVAYVDNGLDGGGEADDERPRLINGEYEDDDLEETEELSLRALALKREEETVFGKWPWRLFNRHVSLREA